MRLRFVIMLLCCGFIYSSVAQTVDEDILLLELIERQGRDLHNNDTLIVGDSIIVLCDTIWDIYPHPLCIPLMYVPERFPSLRDTSLTIDYSLQSIRQNARRYITANCAELYTTLSNPKRLEAVKMGGTKVQRAIVKDIEADRLDAQRALRDLRSPWRRQANLSLQITQNYATENWQQGGVNAFSMLWSAKAFANYKKDNISWQNNVEWRVGLSTVNGDTIHKVNTTDDLFQLYSNFGYQLHKRWYISMFVDFRTNLFPNFRKNSNNLKTTFCTPIRYTMGIGVDYKPVKGLTINLSPATYKLIYAHNSDSLRVDVTEFGIEKGKNMLNEIGSSLRLEWNWRPLREIELETKFYFFTNYRQIETELEIDVDFIINKYLSAKVILHPRYDGTIENVTDRKSRIQFKELISVGFAHTFR